MENKLRCGQFDSVAERNYLNNRYFDIFMSKYTIGNATEEENNFILRKFWSDGAVASFKLKTNEEVAVVGFSKFELNGLYNYLDAPTKARPMSAHDGGLFPKEFLNVGSDIILGYARYSKKPIRAAVGHIVDKIIALEKSFKRNLKALSIPFAAGATSENKFKLDAFFKKLDSDDDRLVFEFSDGIEKPFILLNGVQYNIDKFYAQIQAYNSEILTYLGINNLGSSEKKEHLITGEIDVNNQIIANEGDNVKNNISNFLQRTNAAFGTAFYLIENGKTEQEEGGDENDEADADIS